MKARSEFHLEVKRKASTVKPARRSTPRPRHPWKVGVVLGLGLLVVVAFVVKPSRFDLRLNVEVLWTHGGAEGVASGPSTDGQEPVRSAPAR